MKKLLYIILILIIAFLIANITNADNNKEDIYYIKINTILFSEYEKGLNFYNILKNKGYLVYYYSTYKKDDEGTAIRNDEGKFIDQLVFCIGYFNNESEAKIFGDKFKKNENINYSIEKTELTVEPFIDKYKDQFEIITTPSGIWIKTAEKNKEIFHFAKEKINKYTYPIDIRSVVSPNGDNIVFYYNNKIIKVNTLSGKDQTLVEDDWLINSHLKWSYDGKYIAYLDNTEWEIRTNLWVMESDGTEKKCLVENLNKTQNAVKLFLWHPKKNIIYFIEGYCCGTITVGGNLYLTDLQGVRKELIMADKKRREEIGSFDIKDDFIYYKIFQFDEQYNNSTVSNHKIKIPE